MSFGYGFFIEMEDLFNIRAKATSLLTEEFLRKKYNSNKNYQDIVILWKHLDNTSITFDKILEGHSNFSIYQTYSFYFDYHNNSANSTMFVGKIFQLANTKYRYGSFFQFVEENKNSLDLDRVNTDLKRNGLDSSLCDSIF